MSLFKKKSAMYRKVMLPGEAGTLSVPAHLILQDEDESTILAYPPGDEKINFRFSSISVGRKDDDESAGRVFVKKRAKEEGLKYFELGDKSILSYEEQSESEGIPLVIRYWEIGAGNAIVIISATIVRSERSDKTVREALDAVPAMLESLTITKFHRMIEADGKTVTVTEQSVEPAVQTVTVFNQTDLDWLKTSLEQARALGLKYGSGGELGPEALDEVFSRWMHECGDKEQDVQIADALGSAFGAYLVQHHDFEWAVVTDEYGTEYAVKHRVKESIAFPRASVQKRIEDKAPEFFQNIYLLILDSLKKSGNKA